MCLSMYIYIYIYVKTYALDIFYLFLFNGSSKKGLIVVQSLSHVQLFVIPKTIDWSMPGSSDLHYLLEFAQIHVHGVGDAS